MEPGDFKRHPIFLCKHFLKVKVMFRYYHSTLYATGPISVLFSSVNLTIALMLISSKNRINSPGKSEYKLDILVISKGKSL